MSESSEITVLAERRNWIEFLFGPAGPSYVILLGLVGGGGTIYNQHQTRNTVEEKSQQIAVRITGLEAGQEKTNQQMQMLLIRRDRETDKDIVALRREIDASNDRMAMIEQRLSVQR